jgi:hypothetical protein
VSARVLNLRDHGGELPEGAVYIGRPSKWGKPFVIDKDGTREEVVHRYEHEHLAARPDLMADLPELRGKDLACWCAPKACHGDVLLRLANGGDPDHGLGDT